MLVDSLSLAGAVAGLSCGFGLFEVHSEKFAPHDQSGRAVNLGPLKSILKSLHLMPKSGHEVQASQNVPQTT